MVQDWQLLKCCEIVLKNCELIQLKCNVSGTICIFQHVVECFQGE